MYWWKGPATTGPGANIHLACTPHPAIRSLRNPHPVHPATRSTMKQEIISIPLEIHPDPATLNDADRQLLARAKEQLRHAYAPYSRFQVGAAVLLANGEVVTGNNVENAAYPMCLCAEQTALGAAASRYPETPVLSLAVTVHNLEKTIDQPAGPCGACRQIISEMEDRHQQRISIIMQGETGPIYKLKSAKDLLPICFSGTFLPQKSGEL